MTALEPLLETWEPVIGLEVHVQLATESKAFSPSGTTFGNEPNSLTDPTVLGLPGALPNFNHRALELALRLGVATGSKIRAKCRFARKHYFYPDLPKGYQISQYDEPLCEDGAIEMWVGTERRKVRLQRIHLEEDAGKNMHHGTMSHVDLNRAGVPLCEVVTLPDLHSADEAAEYMRALHRLVRYLGVSEGDMEKGQMRCDANVSVRRRGEDRLGTRTELKNINSFRFVKNAIEHEIARQIRLIEEGGKVDRETRLWDSDAGVSASMRSKEEIADYRYFPDPDLPPLAVDDAATLTDEREMAEYLDAAVRSAGNGALARPIASFMLNELLRVLDGKPIGESPVSPVAMAELIGLVASDVISGKIAKDVFATMCKTGDNAKLIVERDDLRQISDEAVLRPICEQIIHDNPRQVGQYKGGKEGLLGFFVGQLMKATNGKANPALSTELMKTLLATA
jgi:aspartyl-tRNA(Asn)/glutamyl-tRNA(Gln) amidotransferase subunit B